jgi:integrase
MARLLNRLDTKKVEKAADGARLADGGGLYLQVRGPSKVWIFRYRSRATGKERDIGLGPTHTISLARARELAAYERTVIAAGNDPLVYRRAAAAAEKASQARQLTFAQCAEKYIAAHRAGWRNAKHAAQWSSTLATYAKPINSLPVAEIDTALVLKCLEPNWSSKAETMTRVRQRIEAVLDWATVREFRRGQNPARWKGHLDALLPRRSKVQTVVHRAALAYTDMHGFMTELRKRQGLAARALELLILTATRPGEAAGAQWSEFDLDAATWTIPARRMKAEKEHRIPLVPAAVALLRALAKDGVEGHVFPGVKGRAITTAASMALLTELRPGFTVHGFRSTFRDWAGETTAHPREVIEHALAHQLKDKAEAAYSRGDLLQRRAKLMLDWSKYIDTAPARGNVTAIKRKAKA